MLRMDRAKIKWRIKLQKAFNQDPNIADAASQGVKQSKSGKYALFLLPMITVSQFLLFDLQSADPQFRYFEKVLKRLSSWAEYLSASQQLRYP